MARRAFGRWVSCLVSLAMVGCALAPPASADGDPASDALIVQSVFYPYSTSVPAISRATLRRAVAAASRAGVAVKVAIIAHRSDLGSITALYGEPQRYATFLHTEISYGHPVRLLVVMPSGDGAAGFSTSVAGSLRGVTPAGGSSGAALAYAATRAVQRLTEAARRSGAASAAGGTSGHGQTVLLLVLILAAVLIAGAIVVLRVFFPPSSGAASRGGKT